MDLSDKRDLLWLSELIRDLRDAAPLHDPLLVGATARDLVLHYGHDVPIARATLDVDLAFAVADWDEFDALRDALLRSGAFSSGRRAHHSVVHRDNLPVDLIPFGGIENADGRIVWPADEAVMGVLGYREALATAVEICLPDAQQISTVSLSILAILKVLAWSERHSWAPGKDARDLFLVLENYLNGETADRLYPEAAHLLESENFDYDAAGAWLAGHDAARAIGGYSAQPERLLEAVQAILALQVDPDGPLQLVAEAGRAAPVAQHLLRSFLEGLRTV